MQNQVERKKRTVRKIPTEEELARCLKKTFQNTNGVMIICNVSYAIALDIKKDIRESKEYQFIDSKGNSRSRLPQRDVPTEAVLQHYLCPHSSKYIERVRKLEVINEN